MPERYVTIAGFSAVGKKTLIGSLLTQQRYRALLGIEPAATIAAYGRSFQPLAEIFASDATVVLHQWQLATHEMVHKLQQTGRHEVFLLWRPYRKHHCDWLRVFKDQYPGIVQTTPLCLESYWELVRRRFDGIEPCTVLVDEGTGWQRQTKSD